MKFEAIKVGDLLWHQKMTGAFFVVFKNEGGAWVTNLFLHDPLMPLWLVLPRDDEDWVLDDKNHTLTTDERETIKHKMLIWETINQ